MALVVVRLPVGRRGGVAAGRVGGAQADEVAADDVRDAAVLIRVPHAEREFPRVVEDPIPQIRLIPGDAAVDHRDQHILPCRALPRARRADDVHVARLARGVERVVRLAHGAHHAVALDAPDGDGSFDLRGQGVRAHSGGNQHDRERIGTGLRDDLEVAGGERRAERDGIHPRDRSDEDAIGRGEPRHSHRRGDGGRHRGAPGNRDRERADRDQGTHAGPDVLQRRSPFRPVPRTMLASAGSRGNRERRTT